MVKHNKFMSEFIMSEELEEAENNAKNDAPEGEQEEETVGEDPKKVARTMLTEGYDQEGIVDDIVAETGLTQRVVWALKGALAKSGAIPTKKEMEERERKKRDIAKFGGDDDDDQVDEQEGERGVPFRRPRPPYLLLRQVLEEFGVKDRAIDIIVTRCRRQGEMHPTEVQQHLSRIESGIKKSEADYIADEYYFALQHEDEQAAEYGGGGVSSYPRRGGSESSDRTYSGYGARRPTAGGDYSSPTSSRRPGSPRPWDSQSDGALSETKLLDILDRRDRDRDQRDRERTLERDVSDMGKTMVELMQELKHIKENPPTSVPADMVTMDQLKSQQADSYQKAMELQLDTMKNDRKELLDALKDTQKESKETVKEIRDFYSEKIDKMEDKLEDAKRHGTRSTDGYKDDNVRLAADAMDRAGRIIESKEPIKVIIEGLGRMAEGPPTTPARERERVGTETITAAIPEEYLE